MVGSARETDEKQMPRLREKLEKRRSKVLERWWLK